VCLMLSVSWSTWRPNGGPYLSDEIYKRIIAKIAVLNDKAAKLAELWEELMNALRQEWPCSR
jgi:hypothetical protein